MVGVDDSMQGPAEETRNQAKLLTPGRKYSRGLSLLLQKTMSFGHRNPLVLPGDIKKRYY